MLAKDGGLAHKWLTDPRIDLIDGLGYCLNDVAICIRQSKENVMEKNPRNAPNEDNLLPAHQPTNIVVHPYPAHRQTTPHAPFRAN